MPASPVTRQHAEAAGHIALKAGSHLWASIASVARWVARSTQAAVRAIEAVPMALRVVIAIGLLTLLGIVGAIALHNALGLLCIVMVVPAGSIALGALGHRWYSARQNAVASVPQTSELQRSVEYLDKKLTFALNAFAAERHQHAMIALFQAKTAVDLTLGTESETDLFLALDDQSARPRIRPGATALRESTSLAAS